MRDKCYGHITASVMNSINNYTPYAGHASNILLLLNILPVIVWHWACYYRSMMKSWREKMETENRGAN
jgi:hypothetical protein